MYAVEFETMPENGIIKIPESYQSHLAGQVKVIILKEEKPEAAKQSDAGKTYLDELIDSPLEVKGFKPLSREEIYAERT
ncbi:MAG: hypothetical protein GY862_02970 [Gammaproteobacteria bacterium]|nr:hypothetical protein [Gammaproteobacteria bacterium]